MFFSDHGCSKTDGMSAVQHSGRTRCDVDLEINRGTTMNIIEHVNSMDSMTGSMVSLYARSFGPEIHYHEYDLTRFTNLTRQSSMLVPSTGLLDIATDCIAHHLWGSRLEDLILTLPTFCIITTRR